MMDTYTWTTVQKMPTDTWIPPRGTKILCSGVDWSCTPVIEFTNHVVMVLHLRGRTYFGGIGHRAYAPAERQIHLIESPWTMTEGHRMTVKTRPVAEYPIRAQSR